MSDNTVLKLSQPSTFSDPLTEVLRSGARSLLARAVEAEVAAFLDGHSEARTEEGRRRLVRHGHLPEREIMTGIGPVAVRAPRVRDRTGLGADRIRFSSALLPPYARRSKSLEVLIPVLYLKGISTGDFAEALAALLGPDAGGLSASTVARLTEVWADQHTHWLKRDLSARHYVYFWADGIHVQAGLEDDAQCLLVIIGATPEGKKELVGLIDGVRESAQSWRELLLDLKRRGHCPEHRARCRPPANRHGRSRHRQVSGRNRASGPDARDRRHAGLRDRRCPGSGRGRRRPPEAAHRQGPLGRLSAGPAAGAFLSDPSKFSAKRVDPVDQLFVRAARPVGSRGDQLAELVLDRLRQRAPPTASQNNANLRFQSAVKA